MFLGHVPAGYLCTKFLFSLVPSRLVAGIGEKRLLLVGIVGSELPDLDLFYFYLLDGRQHVHHSYWTHIPLFWVCIFLLGAALSLSLRSVRMTVYSAVVAVNVFVHLLLDTIVGKICWFYPFSTRAVALFDVPFVYHWWVWNFIFHWTFLFEIALIIAAVYWMTNSRDSKNVENEHQFPEERLANKARW